MTADINVRATVEYDENDKSVARLTVQIWPMPSSLVEALANHLQCETHAFFKQLKIVNAQVTNLTAKGNA